MGSLDAGIAADLDTAIQAAQAAVNATPPGHHDQAGYLLSLGTILQAQFTWSRTSADRDAALSALAAAAEPGPAPPSLRIFAARQAASLAASSDVGRAADLLESAVRLLGEVAPRQLGRSDQQY